MFAWWIPLLIKGSRLLKAYKMGNYATKLHDFLPDVNKCIKKNRVYLEHYTSILTCGKEELEKFYQRNDNNE